MDGIANWVVVFNNSGGVVFHNVARGCWSIDGAGDWKVIDDGQQRFEL